MSTGHGILYGNPSATAIAPSPAPIPTELGAIPNPFWNSTEILTGSIAGQPGVIRIVDVAGRLVLQINQTHGLSHTIRWDGKDATGRPLSSGTYFYEISAPDQPAVRGKLLKLR